jgi:gliding motility-associated-like protein
MYSPKYIIVLFCFILRVGAQNEFKKWYFGQYAGLDFMTNPPTILTGSMSTNEGCASIADAAGNLVMYTDGSTIYNKLHNTMANGTGLTGNSSTSQSGIIVKQPGNTNLYYVFSLGASGTGTLAYSIVDISLASGNGSVTVKNFTLRTSCAEKLTAARNCNGTDYWILAHDFNSSNFAAFELDATGVNTIAVVSLAGATYTGIGFVGNLKLSPNGKKLAAATQGGVGIQLFDFDASTGQVTNAVTLISGISAYGVEFSPDGTKLYGTQETGFNGFYQWDLCAGSNTAVIASVYTQSVQSQLAGMQLATDGKIYIARYGASTLAVIANPNVSGSGCNFIYNGQSVAPNLCRYNMPNFVTSGFKPPPPPFSFTVSNGYGCQAAAFTATTANSFTMQGCAATGYSLVSYLWMFGDPASGAQNTSTLFNPSHAFTTLGTYTVSLIRYYSCGGGSDTVKAAVNINQPCISVTSTSITCSTLGSATVAATGGVGPYSYTWMPGAQTTSVATGLSPGSYTITVHDFGNNFTYTAQTIFTSLIPLTGFLSNQTFLECFGAATGTASYGGVSGGSSTQYYQWSNGINTYSSTLPYINTLSAGLWSATVTDAVTGCKINDVFLVLQPTAQTVNIAASSPTGCAGSSITFTATSSGGTTPGYNYSWSNCNTNTCSVSETVAATYVYSVTSTDANNCGQQQTVSVLFVPNPVVAATSISICPFQTGTITASGATNYTWSLNGNILGTGGQLAVSPTVQTTYSVTGEALACSSAATVTVSIKPVPVVSITGNATVCAMQPLSLIASGGVTYSWSGPSAFTGSASQMLINATASNHAGIYNVIVTAANSCTAAVSETVAIKPLPVLNLSSSGSSVCLNTSTVTLYAAGTGTLYSWSPAAGLSSTNAGTTNSSPLSATVYSVVSFLNGCSATGTLTVAVVPPPSLSISLSSPSLCAQAFNGSANTVTLIASGASTYTLETPPQLSSTNGPPVSNITTQPPYVAGPATATLRGSNGVCTVASTVSILIVSNPAVSIANPTPVICAGDSYTYTAQGASSFSWSSATAGSTLYTSAGTAVAHPSVNSVFSVYGGSIGCNSASHQFSINVNPLPTLSVTPATTAICTGSAAVFKTYGTGTSFQWWPASYLNTTSGASVISTPGTNMTYSVTAFLNSCTTTAIADVSLLALPVPTISISPPQTCAFNQVTFIGYGAVGYQWQGPQEFYAQGNDVTWTPRAILSSGIYTVLGTDIHQCVGRSTASLTVYGLPVAYFLADKTDGCVPFCTKIKLENGTGDPAASATWELFGVVHTASVNICFNKPGQYVASGVIVDGHNCKASGTISFTAYQTPAAGFSFTPEKPVENLQEVTFTSFNPGHQNSWHVDHDPHPTSDGSIFRHLFSDAGIHPVTLITETDHHCSDTAVRYINVEADFAIYIPNTFTPNEDSRNEVFLPIMRGVKNYQLYIFDRLGNLNFSTREQQRGWDGSYSGGPCKEGIYTWKIILTSNAGMAKEMVGSVLLLRGADR